MAITGDTLDEANETFSIGLTGPVHGTVTGGSTVTITDDDTAPSITVADPTAIGEGNTGTQNLTFTVALSAPSGLPVQVAYQTEAVEARSNIDYVAQAGILTFDPGQTTKPVNVVINADTIDELFPETFELRLDQPVNATIADGLAIGRINDDDATPKFSVGDLSAAEGNLGGASFFFTVTLTAPSERSLTVTFNTAPGTATSGTDYVAVTSGSLTFNPGEVSKPLRVTVRGDNALEPNETFFVNLLTPAPSILDGQGVGTILNDD